ncbi:MAG: hypothetical protein SGJ27_20615 [Candidatus Melainabacteria bacterium]|nr:hypothetical protein [Candidatus Melainabacteria bacterium]
MKSFIIPNLEPSDRTALINQRVIFYPWGKDVLVEEPQLQRALKVLDAKATSEPTDIAEVFRISWKRITHQVELDRASNRYSDQSPRGKYVQRCDARIAELIRQSKEKLDSVLPVLISSKATFTKSSRLFFIANTPEPSQDDLQKKFEDQFQQLISLDKVRTAFVDCSALLVYTHTLYADCPSSGLRELGEFLIVITLDGTEDGVRWFNNTRLVNGAEPAMNAPHVFSDGTACFDGLQQTLQELIAQFEFVTVTELAIQFLEILPAGNPLCRFADRWPPKQPH